MKLLKNTNVVIGIMLLINLRQTVIRKTHFEVMQEAAELYAQAKLKEVLPKAIEMAKEPKRDEYIYTGAFAYTEQEIIDKLTNG